VDRARLRENAFEHNNRILRSCISAARYKISRSPTGACHELEVDVAVAQVSCELSCLPLHQACHQVCGTVNLAEDLSCAPQELLADGGLLQKQREYEQTRGGSGGWTGGARHAVKHACPTRSPPCMRASALHRSAGKAGVDAFCALNSEICDLGASCL
jgi:hypothetical protein